VAGITGLRKDILRMLCISPVFIPRADSEAFCGAKLILELLKRGVDSTIICLDPESAQSEVCDNSPLWEPLNKVTIKIATPSYKNIFESTINGLKFLTITYARWTQAVINMARLLHRENPYDLVYSRSLPMVAHVAGYWTSKLLKIPWIANTNDPWDWHLFPDEMSKKFPYLYRLNSNYWMKKTFRMASLITYPSSRLRDYHYQISGIRHKSSIIPHIGYTCIGGNTEPEFCLVHAGKLGGQEGRSSLALLQGLQLFLKKFPEARQSFRMIFVGPEDEAALSLAERFGIQSIIETTGRISYQRSLEYISLATVCLLVEGKLTEGIFLPSKLADYIAAGKPILALSPKNGVVSDMLTYRGVVRTDVDNPQGIEAAIGYYYCAFKKGAIHTLKPSEKLVCQFTPDVITGQFIKNAQEIILKYKKSGS
jgi:glycosyltransferase involved in cell wall biosynthesis